MLSAFGISSARKNQQAVGEDAICNAHIKFLAVWHAWLNKSDPEMEEQRDIAVGRMMRCLENETATLDLSDLELSSLPSLLPPNGKLFISKPLLGELFFHVIKNKGEEKLLTDFVDNFIYFQNEKFSGLARYAHHRWRGDQNKPKETSASGLDAYDDIIRQDLINYIKVNTVSDISELESKLHAIYKVNFYSFDGGCRDAIHDEQSA